MNKWISTLLGPENENGSCNSTVVGGCLDPLNCGYNVENPATHNDGTCLPDLSEFGGSYDGIDCGGVSLEIQNVDIVSGTLDIFMSNYAGCSYCENSTYNNNTQKWCKINDLIDKEYIHINNRANKEKYALGFIFSLFFILNMLKKIFFKSFLYLNKLKIIAKRKMDEINKDKKK